MNDMKFIYESPSINIIELEVEQIIAASGDQNSPYLEPGDDF